MDKELQERALKFSIIDGALSAVMGSLAGGIFLIGFALKILKATPAQIGILAALPMFANLIQIFGSYIIEKTGKGKPLCVWGALISRILWVLIILLPLKIFAPVADFRVWVLVAVIGMVSILGSLSGIAWLSWMSDLVPENIRGTYFGKRNMIASACGVVAILLGGKFITTWKGMFGESDPSGFIILFAIGLAAGLLALWFLARVPEEEIARNKIEGGFELAVFFKPLKDSNFLWLLIFVSFWMFAMQIAGPFYGVFMINNLKIDFSSIAVFGTFATLATIFMMKIWGPISDKLGNKPILIVAGMVLVIVPFIWIIALPGNYYWPIMLAHILSGAFMAGVSLSQVNVLIKLSPQEGRSVYLALFAAITGLVGAIAPIAGGGLAKIFQGIRFSLLAYEVNNLHIIFIVSAVLQVLTLFLIMKVQEPAAATPMAVVMQLRNDLNPQTGIASTADFVVVELKRGDEILKKVDRVTDELAEKSEAKIKKTLEKGGEKIKKPLEKVDKFLKKDD